MARAFLTPIEMSNLEILNSLVHKSNTDVANGELAKIYFNTTDNRVRIYTTAWETVPFIGSGTPAALTVSGSGAAGTSLYGARLDHTHAMPGLAAGPATNGFMAGSDKAKLDAATANLTPSTLVMRDSNSRFQVATPVADDDAANKGYVDSVAAGLDWKTAVKAATVSTLAISSTPDVQTLVIGGTTLTIDTVSLANGDRVLVKNGTSGTGNRGNADNGIYVVSGVTTGPVTLTRSTDMDTFPEAPAAAVFVEQGSAANADTAWVCTSDAGGTLGTDPITFTKFAGTSTYTATSISTGGQAVLSTTSTANEFKFRGIQANSAKITVSADVEDVLIDVSEADLTLNNIGGTLGVSKGGTGATTLTQYAVLVGNGTSAIGTVGPGTTGYALISQGAGANPTFAQVSLSAGVTGTLPIANGGTGQTTAVAAFDALSPLTTLGDTLYNDGTNDTRLAGNTTTTRQFLSQAGTGTVSAAPAWTALASTDIPNLDASKITTGTFGVARGGTGQSSLTQYAVLVGAGTAAVTMVSPSATAGQALVSQGSGADPIFGNVSLTAGVTGTLPVGNGGTGATSLTQYNLVVGNGTSAVTFIAPSATVGHVLLSNGSSANPSFGQVSLTVGVTGTLPVGNGGTGATTFTLNGVILGNGTSALSVTAAGTANQVLRVPGGGGAPAFGAIDLASSAAVTGILDETNGGTGLNSYTTGDLIYASAANTLSKIAVGSDGQILTVVSGLPAWAAAPTSVYRYQANLGAITANSGLVVTHNLNTRDLLVRVYEVNSPYAEVECTVEHTSVNTVTLTFGVNASSGTYRVFILG